MFFNYPFPLPQPVNPSTIIGPYSKWPRRQNRGRFIASGSVIAAVALFVHCGVPLLA